MIGRSFVNVFAAMGSIWAQLGGCTALGQPPSTECLIHLTSLHGWHVHRTPHTNKTHVNPVFMVFLWDTENKVFHKENCVERTRSGGKKDGKKSRMIL